MALRLDPPMEVHHLVFRAAQRSGRASKGTVNPCDCQTIVSAGLTPKGLTLVFLILPLEVSLLVCKKPCRSYLGAK